MQATITGITHKGEGVARVEGKAVFVPFALPGEEIQLTITEDKKTYAYGRLERIITASPYRTQPLCPHYYTCGGCSFQHVAYEEQLRLKQRIVSDIIKRIGKLNLQADEVQKNSLPYRYRNKVTWHIENGKLGYYQMETNNLVPVNTCLLITEDMEKVSQELGYMLKKIEYKGKGEIIVRQSFYNRQLMLIFNLPDFNPDKISSFLKERADAVYYFKGKKLIHLYGDLYLEEKIGDNIFRLYPTSFFQVNKEQNERIINFIKKHLNLTGKEKILDAYCGVGSIGISLAEDAKMVLGIENNREAVNNAEYNARYNHLANCRFLAGDCEKILPSLEENFDIAVVDPPRSGLKKEVTTALLKKAPHRIVYVSCNPATLARDLKLLTAGGYEVLAIQPFDMFAQSFHVECVVSLKRKHNS